MGETDVIRRDDLKLIKGIGPKLEEQLNQLGIYSFRQLSRITEAQYDLIDTLLTGFQGRARRDNWAEQAREFIDN